MRQRDDKKAQLPGHATDYRPGLAKIHLSVTRWMRQRDKRLLQAQAPRMYIIPHRRIAALKATFLMQPIIEPLDRMALLLRRPYIIMQYLVDKAGMRVELRTPQRHMPPAITQWHRMRHHLRNRPTLTGSGRPPASAGDILPFEVTGEHIELLTERTFPVLLRRLLSAEAQAHGTA